MNGPHGSAARCGSAPPSRCPTWWSRSWPPWPGSGFVPRLRSRASDGFDPRAPDDHATAAVPPRSRPPPPRRSPAWSSAACWWADRGRGPRTARSRRRPSCGTCGASHRRSTRSTAPTRSTSSVFSRGAGTSPRHGGCLPFPAAVPPRGPRPDDLPVPLLDPDPPPLHPGRDDDVHVGSLGVPRRPPRPRVPSDPRRGDPRLRVLRGGSPCRRTSSSRSRRSDRRRGSRSWARIGSTTGTRSASASRSSGRLRCSRSCGWEGRGDPLLRP